MFYHSNMVRIDFSKCELSGKFYGGSEKKEGILFQGVPFMLKFAKKNIYGDCFNDVAEHICCRFMEALGLPVQVTALGWYGKEKVVGCKDFIIDGYKFMPFNDLGESSIDEGKGNYKYRYADIEKLIRKNKKLAQKEAAMSLFWKTYIMDALLANPDRHGKNWGYLKKDNVYSLAPIFDNGSSLFSSFSDEEEMEYVLTQEDEILERVYDRPNSLILYNTAISDYFTVISSLEFENCNKALRELFPLIDMEAFFAIVEKTDLSEVRKKFIKTIVKERYARIIEFSYRKLLENDKNQNG